MIDTHTHLYLKQFNEDIDLVIKRSKEIGVNKFIFPAIDSSHFDSMHILKNKYPDNIYLMSGLHPTNVKENFNNELEFVVNALKTQDYVAIGEIGIDLYWDKSFLNEQQDAFTFQIRLAIKHDLPIVIHCREAFDEIFEILDKENCNKLRGVFHCFTGTIEQAKRAIDLGFVLGIGGVVTFKNGGIDKFLNQIDLKHIVLETDSPYLAPVPNRGKRNESSYIMYVVEKLSEIYGVSNEEIADVTTKNAEKVFAL
ncbi:TatD family hydrolase [Flavobacteriaceae bacterium]|nr:TatD family hydrolase [Flavobacteriaceae bacterium]MDB2567113.1 TatD family hydrolase [Flavobacteriaceae bacterium]MDB4601031.1 TatD family hydrolase [Flavobacteriaceae bacterium]MDC0382457.1 TatD family hydrolase [Flavobacteriaceae bacterium]MDC0506637.1 TatD family hydrolase [Flavobacteriaceae bacterium]